MTHIPLDPKRVERLKRLAEEIAERVQRFVDGWSTTSVERTILRLYGVDGVDEQGTPLPNRLVEMLQENGTLGSGISRAFCAAMMESGRNAQNTAELIEQGKIKLTKSTRFSPEALHKKEKELTRTALQVLDDTRKRKLEKQRKIPLPPQPWRYLIVATGDIYEDRTQAGSAVYAGADIRRPVDGDKGLEGVFEKTADYSNPIMDGLEREKAAD
ncbi:MAG: hypothetical protein GY866_16525 [Proteobacteria bacterium]|nr:hypothetical protein [Pseudomonadota bacterium]